jgi:hypothetical protein
MMDLITVTATVDQDRHLELDVPTDIPPGRVEITIRAVDSVSAGDDTVSHAVVRQRLQAAGLLSRTRYAPADAALLSVEQREQLGRLFAAPQSLADVIDEDRGPR